MKDKETVIFIATTQENSKYIEDVSKSFKDAIILHPFYSFTSEFGKEVFNKLPNRQLPPEQDSWNYIMKKDLFCIKQADVVLYDLDNLPNEGRYLVMAATSNKPIVGISETLKSVPVYFSGSVLGIVKPDQTFSFVKMYFKSIEKADKAEKVEKVEKVEKAEKAEKAENSENSENSDAALQEALALTNGIYQHLKEIEKKPRKKRSPNKSKNPVFSGSEVSLESVEETEDGAEEVDVFSELTSSFRD